MKASLLGAALGGIARDALRGTLIAAACTALALLLALAGFGRLYYLAVFLPFFLLACLLVAWGLYLKDDGFIRGTPRTDAAAAESQGGDELGPEASAAAKAAGLDLSLYAPRSGVLVPRLSEGAGTADQVGPASPVRPGGAKRALLWAALLLGILASALYSWGGVGAGYFLPVAR
ncbi:MAG TPA: hypothetical protein DCG47_05605 [Spirochaetaceae bacterium]|jgi:hypothetical protein|nr:hypothetical protein [Spirochaetaceae bacterium]